MIKAVVLDFDDTLCMTAKSNYMILSEALKTFGHTPFSWEENLKTVGDPLKVTIQKFYPDLDIGQFFLELSKVRDKHVAKGLIEKIPEENLIALDELAKKNKQLMILTSRRAMGVIYLSDPSHHLGSRIAHFYHLDNNPYHKPDPRTFAIIEKEKGLQPKECVYIGDTLHDATAATGAGLHFIANLESGILSQSDFADYQVEAFIKKFPQVVGAIEKLDKKLPALTK